MFLGSIAAATTTRSLLKMNLPRHLQKTSICANCIKRLLNGSARSGRQTDSTRIARNGTIGPSRAVIARRNFTLPARFDIRSHAYSTATTSRGHLRVAIIGSGPAGFYTAHRLLNKVQDAVVDMYEQLPVPYGLVRFGVAPDHPDVKNCQDTFEEVAQSPRFNYVGNVCVGKDVKLLDMKPHYDAILFSYGASEDKKLGIPGEDSAGVYSAREFVAWYNGLPEFQGLKPNLQAGEQAIVIGQGNVALDVARILLSPIDTLRKTDIADHAIQTLSESKIKSVRVVGRRGPLQVCSELYYHIDLNISNNIIGCIHSQRSPRANAHALCRLRTNRYRILPIGYQETAPSSETNWRGTSEGHQDTTRRFI